MDRVMDTNRVDVESLYRPLWVVYGLVPLLAGLDKFFGILTDWSQYLAPWMESLLPVAPQTFLYAVGVIEMAVGILVLTKWTRIGAWIAAAWLTLIALQLVTMGILDVAVRDLAMAVGAYTLARLAAIREEAPARVVGTAAARA